jgi:hypothetical protein
MAIPLVTNIGASGRRRRYLMGLGGLGVALVVAAGLILGGAPQGARVLVILPLFGAALGFLQAHGGT